jgi:hypothetical protein
MLLKALEHGRQFQCQQHNTRLRWKQPKCRDFQKLRIINRLMLHLPTSIPPYPPVTTVPEFLRNNHMPL